MKIYDTYCRLELTYPEIIGYAYSFGEVLIANPDSHGTDLDIVIRLYFDNNKLKAELSDSLKNDIPDDLCEEERDMVFNEIIYNHTVNKQVVFVPYVSGSWTQIKDTVSEACLWIAGQGDLDSIQNDPLKLDNDYLLDNLYVFEGETLLYNLSGDVCDRCVAYCVEQGFPLYSRSIIWPDDIDKAMKKWEKMKS